MVTASIMKTTPATVPILETGRGWLVVDKPFGLSVHNDPARDLCSIVSDFIQNDSFLHKRLQYESEFGVHAPHRLDKHTSGVMIVACRRDVFRYLSGQFENHLIRKRYAALLHGRLTAAESDGQWHEWDRPLSREAGGRRKPQGSGRLIECTTRYRLIRNDSRTCLVECEPLTGRKHQIRRHACLTGHSVIGDKRYGSQKALKFAGQVLGVDRLALHAMAINFKPMGHDEMIRVNSTGLPDCFRRHPAVA